MSLNTEIFYFINNSLSNPVFDFIMPALSNLGSFVFLVCIRILLYFICGEDYKKLIKLCFISLFLSGAVVLIIKLAVREPRPYTVLENVHLLLSIHDPNSFPSGHTSSVFSVISVLVMKSREYFRKYKIIDLLLVVFAFLIAFSRVYVGLHYPFDVMVGGVIGIISGIVVCYFLKV